MPDGYVLSPATADKLSALLGESPGPARPGTTWGSGGRQLGHVLVEGAGGVTGTYYGSALAYDVEQRLWKHYDYVTILEPNEEHLDIGKRFGAVRYGWSQAEKRYLFVTMGQPSLPSSSSGGGGSQSDASSSSGGSGSGGGSGGWSDGGSDGGGSDGSDSGPVVVTDVYCDSGGVAGEKKRLTGTVTVNGRSYQVVFTLSDLDGGGV